jgi:hypothetical protein
MLEMLLTKSVTGLNANTTYYYRVRVYTCALSTNSSYSSLAKQQLRVPHLMHQLYHLAVVQIQIVLQLIGVLLLVQQNIIWMFQLIHLFRHYCRIIVI